MAQSIRDDDGVSNPSRNLSLTAVVDRAIAANPSRRRLLMGGLGAATLPFLAGLSACGGSDDDPVPTTPTTPTERILGFTGVGISSADSVVVPAGYVAAAILPWGEPVHALAPAWKPDATNSAADQEQQVGDNHDGMWFFGFNAAGNGYGDRSDEGLLVVNHEYINPEYFHAPDTDAADWMAPFTFEKARKALAAHGATVAHVKRAADGSWEHVKSSPFNRRIHGNTPMTLQGPAAGHALMRTAADPSGTEVLGMLNNCGNGWTPWGTYLTCEENWNGYFGAPTSGATIAPGSRTRRPRSWPASRATASARKASATAGTRWTRASTPTSTPTSRTASAGSSRSTPSRRPPSPSSAPRWAASSTRTPSWWWRPTARSSSTPATTSATSTSTSSSPPAPSTRPTRPAPPTAACSRTARCTWRASTPAPPRATAWAPACGCRWSSARTG
jgi:secreted PhoX family phosphatase